MLPIVWTICSPSTVSSSKLLASRGSNPGQGPAVPPRSVVDKRRRVRFEQRTSILSFCYLTFGVYYCYPWEPTVFADFFNITSFLHKLLEKFLSIPSKHLVPSKSGLGTIVISWNVTEKRQGVSVGRRAPVCVYFFCFQMVMRSSWRRTLREGASIYFRWQVPNALFSAIMWTYQYP